MKNRIRREILKRRAMLGESDWNEKSRSIQDKFLNADFYKKPGSVLLYCHFDREVKTDLLIRNALDCGKIVCVPFNDWKRNIFTPSRIRSLEDVDNTGKIPQPFISTPFPPGRIELAVIPGVVFDVYGNRTGMGKGFYDRFLDGCRQDMLKISLAFDFQVLDEELPVDSWDRKVDVILTEKRFIDCRRS